MIKKMYMKTVYIKSLTIPIVSLIFIFCLILYSESAVNAATRGINLWLNVVFPSLFPFFVGAELLNKSGIIRALGILFEPIMRPIFNIPGCGSFAFIMGLTSGYPVGAKLTTSMYEDKMLSKSEAERLLAFSNNSGPLFIVGAVAVGMFNQSNLGILLLTCHIMACITVGILFGFYSRNINSYSLKRSKKTFKKFKSEMSKLKSNMDFGTMIGFAIKDSVMIIFLIGGFIIFFSVVISLLLDLGVIESISGYLSFIFAPLGVSNSVLSGIISGFFEITTGTNMVSKTLETTLIQKLTATSAIIGWAGFSVHFQVMSIVKKTDMSIKPYLLGKFAQGLIAAFYTYIALKFFNLRLINEAPAFIPWEESNKIFFENLAIFRFQFVSLIFLAICILVVAFTGFKNEISKRY